MNGAACIFRPPDLTVMVNLSFGVNVSPLKHAKFLAVSFVGIHLNRADLSFC